MAPEYAGLLNALANTLGNYCGFVTAAMAGFLFDSLEDDEKAWNYIFIINGAIALTCGTYIREHPVDAASRSIISFYLHESHKDNLFRYHLYFICANYKIQMDITNKRFAYSRQ